MTIKLANNVGSRLSSPISESDTAISVLAGEGVKFPTLAEGETFPVTVVKADGTLEIMRCTARSGDMLTVLRAQEGTAPQEFSIGDRIELRITAAVFDERVGEITESIVAPVRQAANDAQETADLAATAAGTTFDPAGGITSTDVQAALAFLGGAKLNTNTNLGSSTNLNTLGAISAQGVYYQASNANATSGNGYPVTTAGALLVLPSAYGCQQVYIPFDGGRIFTRGLSAVWNGTNGPWSVWQEIGADSAPTWAEITGKPATFPPTIGTTATTAKAGNYVPSWGEVSGKPTTFAPAAHTHPWSQITSPPVQATRWPTWGEVSGKPEIPTPNQSLAYNAVGQYILGRCNTVGAQNLTVSGSVLFFSNAGGTVTSAATVNVGTWRRLGMTGGSDANATTLYLRIS